jgi:hypothetical protein
MDRSPPVRLLRCRPIGRSGGPMLARVENRDANDISHYPGCTLPALKYLYEQRKITASGHKTTDTGIAISKDDYSLETYILSTNDYQIELLTNIDQGPEAGAIAVVSFPKPRGGSGFPARHSRLCREFLPTHCTKLIPFMTNLGSKICIG